MPRISVPLDEGLQELATENRRSYAQENQVAVDTYKKANGKMICAGNSRMRRTEIQKKVKSKPKSQLRHIWSKTGNI